MTLNDSWMIIDMSAIHFFASIWTFDKQTETIKSFEWRDWVHVWAIWVIISLDNVDAFRLPAVSANLLHCILQVSAILHLTRTDFDCARLTGAGSVYRSSLYLVRNLKLDFHLQDVLMVTRDSAMRYVMRRENEKKVGNLRPGFTSLHLLSSNVKCNTHTLPLGLTSGIFILGLIWSKFLCPAPVSWQ